MSAVRVLNGPGVVDQFVAPASFISHSFWRLTGSPTFQGRMVNFFKSVAILEGLPDPRKVPRPHSFRSDNASLRWSVP